MHVEKQFILGSPPSRAMANDGTAPSNRDSLQATYHSDYDDSSLSLGAAEAFLTPLQKGKLFPSP